jgi:hypothetical protein
MEYWRVARQGLKAGLVGAATVALWFLVFDLVQGVPLRTPAVLGRVIGGALRGHPVTDPNAIAVTLAPVVGYTLIHLLAFAAVGLVAAFLVEAAEREPAMLLALLIFFGAFEVSFLALVVFLAQPLLGVLSWWAILIGNFLAAVSMLAYFFVWHRRLAGTLVGRWMGVVGDGVTAGLIGAAVVAVWFLIYDTLRFQPFRTPALLGAAIFEGLRDPQAVATGRADLVLGYTVLHLAAFAAFGILAAALIVAAEREPRLLLGLFILFACFEVFFLGFVSALDEALVGALLWWNVAIGNVLATAAMLTYFFLGHRAVGARVLERWNEDV